MLKSQASNTWSTDPKEKISTLADTKAIADMYVMYKGSM